jgi:glycosyltransferase involved in cell wall biosynthesis
MRILMLNHNPKGAGTYFRCLHFARHLVRRGHEVTIMTCVSNRFKPDVERVEGVRVIGTPRFRRVADLVVPGGLDSGFLDIAIRTGHAAFNRYDLIHGFDHLPNVSFPSYFTKKVRRVPFVSDWCDWWTRGGFPYERFSSERRKRFELLLEEGIRKVADGVTVISSVLRGRAEGLGIEQAKIRLIPSGADVENIRPMSKREARERLGIAPDAYILCFVGFVHQDVDLVIKALKIISERLPAARALVVGVGASAEQAADALGIRDRVILAGIKPYGELPAYYAAADVLAMPLRDTLFNRARWPNKIGDHLAAGRPTVTNPVGDVQQLFREHPVGLLAREGDAEDFARQVTKLFENPDLAERMGREARGLAEREYSWERMTARLESFYHEVLSGALTPADAGHKSLR